MEFGKTGPPRARPARRNPVSRD